MPPYQSKAISTTTSPNPAWTYGDGAEDPNASPEPEHVEIDPFAKDRPMFNNYSLLVSGILPRPIGFISTLSSSGEANLAPFSYFQVVDHDPPVFVVGFSGREGRPKDTLRNLEETGECVFNVVSEHMIEAVNATSLDIPYGSSEWDISGLTKAKSTTVGPARVRESVFSIEGKVIDFVEYKTSRKAVGPHGKLAVIEATRFGVREDAVDLQGKSINLERLRPVGQLGGIGYARITDTFELARSSWRREMEKPEAKAKLEDLLKQSQSLKP